MIKEKIIITGGAGFIGINLIRVLLKNEYSITVFDNFNPQVHGKNGDLPADLKDQVNLIIGDVTDSKLFRSALRNQDYVIHLAAETGTGQSMYKIEHYSKVNIIGTSILCDYLVNSNNHIKKVVLASSRAIYGEGKYECSRCGVVYPLVRNLNEIQQGRFNPVCPNCKSSETVVPKATDENSKPIPTSIYGITKYFQEELLLATAQITGIDAFILRLQNVYGPGQSLNNPYTGILSIFSRLAMNDEEIQIYEDGKESRDFVFIDDVVQAFFNCIDTVKNGQYILNVGSGIPLTVYEVARLIVNELKSESPIRITGRFRAGDIRHNFADLKTIYTLLSFQPKWRFADGLHRFLDWIKLQENLVPITSFQKSLDEINEKGLLYSGKVILEN